MADVRINDLPTASITSSMQLETDIGGTQSNKIDIAALTTYLTGVLPLNGITWNVVTTNTSITNLNGYITNSVSQIVFTLPSTMPVGGVFRVVNFSSGGWRINQNSGQTIYFGTQTTTPGSGGYCTSTDLRDCVEVICVNANTDFVIFPSNGNINLI